MILTPYRNPPYRTPTRNGDSASPPPGPSPSKRKRTNSEKSRLSVQIDESITDDRTTQSGPDSPRTKVADRLRELEIQQTPPTALDSTVSPRKRLKRNSHLQALHSDHEPQDFATPVTSSQQAAYSERTSPVVEIGETPDCRSRLPSSPIGSPQHARSLFEPNESASEDEPAAWSHQRLTSPPPRTRLVSPPPPEAADTEISQPTSDASETGPSDPLALTWQDNEITGHDIDWTSPDDDGEGINGIGFKPTPAMAYARSQKRKQQVNEWRAREAREARQRRIERRRGGGTSERRSSSMGKRSVRFEGAG